MLTDEVEGDLVRVRLSGCEPAAATDAVDEADVKCCEFDFNFTFILKNYKN
jgi:hypothetical protein